ncbi:uncharacterized protein C8R40DRAFT_1163890 [Lentinula edodes]|uniref:uncharacterized protein n=1 Tax=Lentinula edodes TaxID=5353 RepID=UPI001E8CB062|nr:uncharacterized protein C8R40DRAFT_1163890 [Lentinula edodes]KAH7868676.1 hypothetical protein C8R40DRAFT_1163890 [Lentinula edodes]
MAGQGRPDFHLRVIPWSNDVSGNVSKQYNAHTNIYISNANILHQKLAQEYFVRYCSTLAIASSSEQFVALCEDFDENHWEEAYDCELKEQILFQLIPHFLPANNPQQLETTSHIGVNGNHNYRQDLTGGLEAEKESVEGYSALYHTGTAWTVEQTIQCIQYQVWLACLGNREAICEVSTASGIKDKISQFWIKTLLLKSKELQDMRLKRPETRDPQLAGLKGIDPYKDSPVKSLHTYLLGIDKYDWHITSSRWNTLEESIFATWLEYKNSLIGKHFKTIQQLAVFHIHDLCTPLVLDLWKATGELGAFLWMAEILDMEVFLGDLQVLIDNVLDCWAAIDPQRIITKVMLHILIYLVQDIHRFGPSVIFSTKVLECFNAVFQMCSILSNHLSPSHDIAVTLGDMECFKHMV